MRTPANREAYALIMERLASLPDCLREPLDLWLRGYRPREIAEELGLNAQDVRNRVWRGKNKLSVMLQNDISNVYLYAYSISGDKKGDVGRATNDDN